MGEKKSLCEAHGFVLKNKVTNFDELAKSQKITSPVIPAKAGIQTKQELLDPGFRRGDGFDDFLRSRQFSQVPFWGS